MNTPANFQSAMILPFPVRQRSITTHHHGMADVSAAVIAFPRMAKPAFVGPLCDAALDNCWYHDEALKAGS